jgi:hypothetical protein
MFDLAEIQAAYYIVAATGVIGALLTAIIGVKSYINSNKRAEEARKRELETRQAQLLMAVYDKISEPRVTEMWLNVVNSKFDNYPEFKKKFVEDPEGYKAIGEMAMIFEGFGVLVREKLVDIRLVALLFGGVTRMYFDKLKPVLGDLRKDLDYPRFMDQTEYLYNQLLEYMARNPELLT